MINLDPTDIWNLLLKLVEGMEQQCHKKIEESSSEFCYEMQEGGYYGKSVVRGNRIIC